jgi:hypothetical protein
MAAAAPIQPPPADGSEVDVTNEPLDPQLAEQMRVQAENAAESGAAQALTEAQMQQAREREAEQAEAEPQEHAAGSGYDLGEEFGLGPVRGKGPQGQPLDPNNPYAPPQAGGAAAAQTSYGDPHRRTFLTGLDSASQSNLHGGDQTTQSGVAHGVQPPAPSDSIDPNLRMSDEELIAHVEHQMLEYERTAQYLEAEKARQHLESLKKRFLNRRRDDLERIQAEDVKVFFAMVAQHQDNFDRVWSKKTLEHKLRADDLIDALKWKHEDQQRELYEALRKKRMPKFSVELLNMRKRQVLLAKSKNYIAAEKVKRKADVIEAMEIERIREAAKEENQLRFQALLKKQEWDRKQLAAKLKIEKKSLLEAKAQDFLRLKKRLRNAEQELKKTHIRQQLLADKKLLPLYSYNAQTDTAGQGETRNAKFSAANTARGTVLRNTGMQRVMGSTGGASAAGSKQPAMKSARELARAGSGRVSSSYNEQQAYSQSQRTGHQIMAGDRPASKQRGYGEEKDAI